MGAPINSMGAIAKDMNWHHYYYRAIAKICIGIIIMRKFETVWANPQVEKGFLGLFFCDSPLRFQCENQMGG